MEMDDKEALDARIRMSVPHPSQIDGTRHFSGIAKPPSLGTVFSMPLTRVVRMDEEVHERPTYRSCRSSIANFSSLKAMAEEEAKAEADPSLKFFRRLGRRTFLKRISDFSFWISGQRRRSGRAQVMEHLSSPDVLDMDVFDRLRACFKVPPPIVLYDATTPYSLLFTHRGSVLKLVFQRLDFAVLLIAHMLLSFWYYKIGGHHTSRVGLDGVPTARWWPELPLSMLSVPTMLLAFILVFYNNQCYQRFSQQYLHCQFQHGCLAELVLLLRSHIPDDLFPGARTIRLNLWRLLHAVHLLGYAGLPQVRARDIDLWVWQYALERHLLSREEIHRLKVVLGIGSGNFAFKEVMTTIHQQFWDLSHKNYVPKKAAHMFSEALWRLRSQIDILYIMTAGPIPFGYFHLSNSILILYLGIVAYAFVFVSPLFSIVGYFLILSMFLGISELSNVLADPFGDDETDLPIFDWVNTTYNSMKELIHLPLVYDEELEANIISKIVFNEYDHSFRFKETDDSKIELSSTSMS